MKIKFLNISLQCRESKEIIDLSHQISFFHGKIGSGKSSIVRLIDYCLGGKLEKTPAIKQELVSVSLTAIIGKYEVLFERGVNDLDSVQVTWRDKEGNTATVLAPIQSKKVAIWEDNIENLSDLIFYLMGFEPLKVRKSKTKEESPLIRLSFRDFMWYCYLDQDHLDSSFYRLEDTFKRNKSRDVMRFVFGYYSEKLNNLEIDLEQTRNSRTSKLSAAKELRIFLKKFGYDSDEEIEKEIENIKENLANVMKEREKIENGYRIDTHSGDELREKIKEIIANLDKDENILIDLSNRIDEQESLRAELLSSKFKLVRTKAVSKVLSNVFFETCPACGTDVKNRIKQNDICELCGSKILESKKEIVPQIESIRLDIDSRIKELENSISLHKETLLNQHKKIEYLKNKKTELDIRLQRELENYESIYLSKYREIDRKIATYQERLKNQNRLKLLPSEILELESEADKLAGDEQKLKRQIEEERKTLTKAIDYVEELEEVFLNTLLIIGLPGVTKEDKVKINVRTWNVSIFPKGEESLNWDFFNAGSGGKKTLFNVCYLLSIHLVAVKNGLPLPSIIMIDTPMKNIGEDVNVDLFNNFYKYLYELANGVLNETQFLIIDKEYIQPDIEDLDIVERYMTPDEVDNPPLISYYRGP
ncbi:MAG: hypothetical protein ACFFDN_22435 [Candidatus Hodarchaeota archaeon]